MFQHAIRIARVRGIDVRVTRSWVLIALLVVALLSARFASQGHTITLTLAMAVAGTLGFFLSVLAHEIAHALTAQRRGVHVHGITLFLFGGVTEMHLEVRRPWDEFAVAAVGPYVSLVIAAATGIVVTRLDATGIAELRPVTEVAGLLGWLNVLLALFNLIPGAPLDGGRVLRSLLWAATGDQPRAMRWASRAGQAVGLLLAPAHWAIVQVLVGRAPNLLDLAITASVGWFIFTAASGELQQARFQASMGDRVVGDLRLAQPPGVPADRGTSTLGELLAHPDDIVAVLDRDGRPRGVLTAAQLTGPDRHRTAGELARPIDQLPTVSAESPVRELLRTLDGERPDSMPDVVVEEHDGAPRRLVTRSAALAAVRELSGAAGSR